MEVKIYTHCRTEKRKADGRIPVYLLLVKGRQRVSISTEMTTFTPFTGEAFPGSEANHRGKTMELLQLYSQVENICIRDRDKTLEQIKRAVQREVFGRGVMDLSLIGCIKECMKTKSLSNQRIYENLIKHIEHYKPKANIEDVDRNWLKNFERSLKNWRCQEQELSLNSKSKIMRTLRSVLNYALAEGYINQYAFRGYQIKSEETLPRAISVEQLRMLRDYPVEPWQEEYRDLFFLSFYLAAINAGDLLTCKGLVNGRLVYYRAKTHKPISVPVYPEAQAIINKYAGKEYLLSPMERYRSYSDYLHHWNDGLKKIGKTELIADKTGKMRKVVYHPIIDRLTTYVARYTFASIAAEIGIDETTIGLCLGHSWAKTVTQRYLAISQHRIDAAIRRVIDYVNEDKKSNS